MHMSVWSGVWEGKKYTLNIEYWKKKASSHLRCQVYQNVRIYFLINIRVTIFNCLSHIQII